MIRFCFILCFLVVATSLFGQQALSDNINGQWCIYSNGERTMLDPAIHELGNFDACGLSYFMRYEKFGILNDKGAVIVDESYTSIKQLEGGYYLMLKDGNQFLGNWKNNIFNCRKVGKTKSLDRNWYLASFDSSFTVINLKAQKEWVIESEEELEECDFGYMYCRIGDTLRLFDAEGIEVDLMESLPQFGINHLYVNTPEIKKIIFRSHELLFPNDAESIQIREDEIMYRQGSSTTILNAIDGKVKVIFPFNDVSYYTTNLFLVRQGGKVGLYDRKGQMLVPIKYTSISAYGGLYNVRTASGAGVLNKEGRELVPCKYDYVVAYKDFFTLHNALGLVGLMSRVTDDIILTCDYSKMVLSNLKVRAFSNDMLRIIELDSNHRFIKDITLTNVISLVKPRVTPSGSVDERLYPLGWFNDLVPEYDSLGYVVNERLKWGLKGENDSILISARYKQPIFVHQADFSLLEVGAKKMTLMGLGEVTFPQLQLMSHRTGKAVVPEPVLSVDTMDLLTRSYSRFISEKGPSVLLDNDKILRVDYIDGADAEYVRYCTSKKRVLEAAKKTDFDALRYPDYNLNNALDISLKVNLQNKDHEFIRFLNAEWNFLDTSGRTVFSSPFDFVEPYHYGTAIVLKDGKWGVASADSFVIPMMNVGVKRSPISDTLFVVQRKGNGTRFLDTTGRVLTNGITQVFSNKGAFAQVLMNGKKVLIAPDYSLISGDTRFQKIFDNGVFYSRENKEYTVYDAEGSLLGSLKEQPEEVWFENYALIKSRGKMGVVSMGGDTLIPFKYKEIRQTGNYIFAKDGDANLLYDKELNRVQKCKSNEVLIDSISGNYAVVQLDKAIMYNSVGDKIGKVSGTKLDHFYNGRILDFSKQMRILGGEEEQLFDFQAKSIEHLGKNGCLIIDSEKNGHYFDAEWNEVTFESTLNRAEDVGEGLSISRGSTETLLFGGGLEVKFEGRWKNIGRYTNGFLLLVNGKEYQFVDVNGINQFKRIFDDAEPFSGELAAVKETDGWTLIDGNGHFRILPSFGRITPHTQTLFSTPGQVVHGLFDSHGNELIPVEFQQLNFLRNNIIQGRKNGEIFYFDVKGVPIEFN